MVLRVLRAAGISAGLSALQPRFQWLFNSYYESFSAFPEKRLRSSFARPGSERNPSYREHVDAAMDRLFEGEPEPEALRRIELGANHEEQHQELLLTDILNAFFTNPLRPKYQRNGRPGTGRDARARRSRFSSLKADCAKQATRATASASTTSCRGIACGSSRFTGQSSRHMRRICGVHCRRRLPQAGALAFCRMGNREGKWLARSALLDRRRTAHGASLLCAANCRSNEIETRP